MTVVGHSGRFGDVGGMSAYPSIASEMLWRNERPKGPRTLHGHPPQNPKKTETVIRVKRNEN